MKFCNPLYAFTLLHGFLNAFAADTECPNTPSASAYEVQSLTFDFVYGSQQTSIEKCNNYDGYQEWLTKHKYTHNGDSISNNIHTRLIKNSVINKLQNVFPDSNITKSYKNCCEYYRINW